MQNKVFDPLAMTSTKFALGDVDPLLLANGSSTGAAADANVVGLGWSCPSGGIYSTTRDMTVFWRFLSDPENFPALGLSRTTMRQWMLPVATLPDGLAAFGLPWEIVYQRNSQAWQFGKSGALGAFSSQLYFLPDYEVTLVVLSNIPGQASRCRCCLALHRGVGPSSRSPKQPRIPLQRDSRGSSHVGDLYWILQCCSVRYGMDA
jgi:CubicO group peptidase (beta-lactamase class C family)